MAAIPAISKVYSARGNLPFGSTASALELARSQLFNYITHLLNTASGGTTSGTRDANSVWTVVDSSDGVTYSSSTNLILTRANLNWAAAGANHSWIRLSNASIGYQIVFDCINATSSNLNAAACPIATPFTGGSLTNRPVNTAAEFLFSSNATGDAITVLLADATTGGTNQTHFVTSTDGQFCLLTSRTGTGQFSTCMALLKTTGGAAGDTRNVFWVGHSVTSGRGTPSLSFVGSSPSGCSGRSPGGAIMNSGGVDRAFPGGTDLGGSGLPTTDSQTGKTNIQPCPVYSATASNYSYRGILPDWYFTPPHTVGTSIPSTAAQTRIVAGDFIVPFPGVVPNV